MRKYFFLISLFIFTIQVSAQQLDIPNFAWASHPMKINSIKKLQDATVIELSLTNQRTSGGSFCADKNIYIVDVLSGKKYFMNYSKGIPVCPDSYKFTGVGEVLTFQLYFPPIDAKTKYINIVENCDNYCFSISGVILDEGLNKDINLAYQYYTEEKLDFAIFAFKKAVENTDYPFGKFYIDLIQIYVEKNDINNAKIWFNKLKSGNFIDKNEVLHHLQNTKYYNRLVF